MKVPLGSKTKLVSKFLNLVTKRKLNVKEGVTHEQGVLKIAGQEGNEIKGNKLHPHTHSLTSPFKSSTASRWL